MVTHDPEEALAICDQVAVLSGGYWHQCAPPQQLVAKPATAFVATFVLQANVLSRDALRGLTSVGQQRACDQMQAGSTSSWLVRQRISSSVPMPPALPRCLAVSFWATSGSM